MNARNNIMGKVFCEDCGIRIRVPEKKGLFKKKSEDRPPVEYSDGWRCSDCAQIYRQRQSYKQQKEEHNEDKSREDEKILRAI